MGIYKNYYTKEGDECLWELHQARHRLHSELRHKQISRINKSALDKYHRWLKQKKDILLGITHQ